MKTRRSRIDQKRREAKESLERLRKLVASRPSPFAGLSVEQAIQRMRSVRAELWNQKFAARS